MKHFLACVVAVSTIVACNESTEPKELIEKTPDVETVLDHSGLTPLESNVVGIEEQLSGGDATVFLKTKDAFSTRPDPIAKNFQHDGNFTSGDHLFRTPHADMGPLLSTGTCQGCHLNDGRGVVPQSETAPMTSMLFKIANSEGVQDPIYGDQIQPFAIQGFTSGNLTTGYAKFNGSINGTELYGEAFPYIEYETIRGQYPDGEAFELRKPVYKVKDLSFGPFINDVRFSPRLAPQVFGVGLLAEIPEPNIISLADENDANNDGISGRVSMVTDAISGIEKIGRFAYKAQNPTILQQVAGAYNGDIGITTSIFSNEGCTANQLACEMVANQENKTGQDPDFSDLELALVEFYSRVLGVPARRGYDPDTNEWDDDILAGRSLFFDNQCTACHTPRHVTGVAEGSVLGEISLVGLEENAEPIAMLSNQVIYPFTDLLLHDMGGACAVTLETSDGLSCQAGNNCTYVQRCDGLADGMIQGNASGSEWKTPALWGIGLVQTVNANSTFLHDGRARTLEEAILWHGGEAEMSKNSFMALSKVQREQLIQFVMSL